PVGPVYQAGTLSGNPLAVTTGLTQLRMLRNKEIYDQLERATARLVTAVGDAASEAGIQTISNRVGSMYTMFFTSEPVFDWNSASKSNREMYGRFFHAMLDEGVYLAPSQFEAAFVSAAHTEELIDRTIAAARRAFTQMA
ncbi:MAG TPA: aspartate aminotransferase family protein, partial [Blastocatellia bacterium]|nr:aspartate aminotransferase family protein [Blastocatellia bacterium]